MIHMESLTIYHRSTAQFVPLATASSERS